jgi:hypothetical protein
VNALKLIIPASLLDRHDAVIEYERHLLRCMSAGAVAILSAMENADAALVMATADATGRTNREKIIKAIGWLMVEKCKAQREPY